MTKLIMLIFIVFFLCNCASNKPGPEPAQLDTNPEMAQAPAGPPEADSGPLLDTAKQPDISPEPASTAGVMEEVEVEGIKEKRHCTRERRTGTRIATTYCRTYFEDEQQKKAARHWLNTIKSKPQASTQKG